MQIFTPEMIITAIGTYFDTTRKLIATIFAALYQNIGQSLNGMLHSGQKVGSALVLVGSSIILLGHIKARKLDFIRSIFSI